MEKKYCMRVRGEVVSNHRTENGALRALKKHNAAAQGTALYADIVRYEGGAPKEIGHLTDIGLEWYSCAEEEE